MNISIPYSKIVTRFFFILILIGFLFGSQLFSDNPSPFFREIKNFITAHSFWSWLFLLLGLLFVLWIFSNFNPSTSSADSNSLEVMRIPIGEAVKSKNSGNGLASIPFPLRLKWFNVVGWINIQDPDKESIVIDGKHIIHRTQIYCAPLTLIGKPFYARRVLLSPSPLEDISAKALTRDQLELTLEVSVKFSVIDPTYVASLSSPLSELNNLITGILVECIHLNTLEELVKDDGTLRQTIKKKLESSESIQYHYRIDGVLKALPTGDERIIEIIRKTREAYQSRALVEQEGQNREISAFVDLKIERSKAELNENIKKLDFDREVQLIKLQNEYAVMMELLRGVAQIVASGINPSPAIKEIKSLLTETHQKLPQPTPINSELPLIEIERNNIIGIREKIGIVSFEIIPNSDSKDLPGKASINLKDCSIEMTCLPDYPNSPPKIFIISSEEGPLELTIPWYYGSNLVDAVSAAIMQIRTINTKSKKTIKGG